MTRQEQNIDEYVGVPLNTVSVTSVMQRAVLKLGEINIVLYYKAVAQDVSFG